MSCSSPNGRPKALARCGELLTVVIPHFNQRAFLPRAVNSVIRSAIDDIEIIIVDDGSTDGSEPVLAALERLDPRVRVIRWHSNQGAPAALNAGLAAARGRYISFLGADDAIMPTLYGPLIDQLEDNQGAAFACSEIAIFGDDISVRGIRPLAPPSNRLTHLSPEDVARESKTSDNWICNTSTVYRTALVQEAGGYDPTLGSFCDGFLSRVLAFKYGFVFVPGVRAAWRVASDTLSASAVSDETSLTRLTHLAHERLTASIVGQRAPSYPDRFVRRLRFGAARLQFVWNGSSTDPITVARIASNSSVDRQALSFIQRILGFRHAGQVVSLAWLFVRLRPIALSALIRSGIRNRLLLARMRPVLQSWILELETDRQRMLAEMLPHEASGSGNLARDLYR